MIEMKEKYKFLEHTADAKFQAFGKNLEDAFANAALAMSSVMVDCSKVEAKIKKEINLKGRDSKALLYNFLEELLFLLDSEKFLLNKVESIEIKKNKGDYKLRATMLGDTISDKYELHGEVKAVTYNEMLIQENPCMVQVVVDL